MDEYQTLTFLWTRGRPEIEHTEVIFGEYSRIFSLDKAHPRYDEFLGMLNEGERVKVKLGGEHDSWIEDIKESDERSQNLS